MLMPTLLQVALDRGLCSFFHDQFKMLFPPRSRIVMDYTPPTTGVVWLTFAMTFGDIPEDSLEVWHYTGDGRVKRHLDPMWYSLGIGAGFEYPLWCYVSTSEPHVLEIENVTDSYVEADITLWMCEFTTRNLERFRRFLAGIYNFYSLFSDYEAARALTELLGAKLVSDLYPELKTEARRRLRLRMEELAGRLGIRTE